MTTRSRSHSIGSLTMTQQQQQQQQQQKEATKFEGVNLYAPNPVSAVYNQMVEDGRERALKFFENPLGKENVKHDASFMGIFTKGNAELDKFRIISQSQNGFNVAEESTIQNYAGAPCERGGNARTLFVYVAHTKYEKRLLGFELSRRDWCTIMCAICVGVSALYAATLCDIGL